MGGALVELLAHVLAGGSVNERFVPAITTGRRVDRDAIVRVFEALGVDAQIRHADSDGRATEVYPTADASVLGRCLVAMGAPRGVKTNLDAIPRIVWGSPEPIRQQFVESYIAHRAVHFDEKATTRIQEERPASYLADLHKLISEFVTEPISHGPRGLTISAAAARELGLA